MTSCPGNGYHKHQAQPSQAAGLDDIAVAGPDRVAVDATGSNLGPSSALDGIVQRHDQGPDGAKASMRAMSKRRLACRVDQVLRLSTRWKRWNC